MERTVAACEMKYLNNAVNKTRTAEGTKWGHHRLGWQLGTKPILDQIEHHRIKWFAHLMKMDPNQPALRTYTSQLSGSKPRGRPRRRWLEGIKQPLSVSNISMADATHRAQERCPLISLRLWKEQAADKSKVSYIAPHGVWPPWAENMIFRTKSSLRGRCAKSKRFVTFKIRMDDVPTTQCTFDDFNTKIGQLLIIIMQISI